MAAFSPASATAVSLAVLSGFCVLVRLLARIAFVHHVGPDDCLIALAWAASMAMAVVTHQNEHNHGGSATAQSGQEAVRLTNLLRQLWSSNITYNLAVLLLKDSLLFQYLRFSIDVGYRRACWALGTIITAYGVSALFVSIFSCQPVSYSWNSQVHGGKCIDFLAFWLFNASFNSATDIIVCVLPTPVLKALQLPRKQMVILACIFLLGAFVCIASIIRIFAVYSATVNNQNDPAIAIWSAVEVNIGIICACLPSLRHPVTQLWPRILARHQRRTAYESGAESHASIGLTTLLKYPDASLKGLEKDDLSRSSSIQSEAEIPYTSPQPTQAEAREHTGADSSKPHGVTVVGTGTDRGTGTSDEDTSASTYYPLVVVPADWKGSSPTISTVTELEEPLDESSDDTQHIEITTEIAEPIPLTQLTHVPLAAAVRPLGPRLPALQRQSEPLGPPPAQAPPPPVMSRSHQRSKSKRVGPSRPLFPMACIPESSVSNTPEAEDDHQDDAESGDHDQDENHHPDNDLSLSRTSSSHLIHEPTIIIPPQQYQHQHPHSHPHPHPPESPSSTYSSTSITTVSTNHSITNIAPWDSDWDGERTNSYEILGGPQAMESVSSTSVSASARVPQSMASPTARSKPTSPIANGKLIAESTIAAAVTSHDNRTSGVRLLAADTNQRSVGSSASASASSSSSSPSSSKKASPLKANARLGPRPAPASAPRPQRPVFGLGPGVGLGVDLNPGLKSSGPLSNPNPNPNPNSRSGTGTNTNLNVGMMDKYAREQARRDQERAHRKQREYERELERIQQREMQKHRRALGGEGAADQSSPGPGGERPRGPREMR